MPRTEKALRLSDIDPLAAAALAEEQAREQRIAVQLRTAGRGVDPLAYLAIVRSGGLTSELPVSSEGKLDTGD